LCIVTVENLFVLRFTLHVSRYTIMVDIDEIKKRLDIEQVIGEYVTLKKSGTTLKALCPFHSERTPSFTVSPERGTWHCFGCNEGGDVISFVQKIDGLEFREALERLAQKAGVELTPLKPADIKARSDKSTVLVVLESAAKLYHELLLRHPAAAEARTYLEQRGVNAESIKKFRLGFAPNAWHTIEQLLHKKQLEPKWGSVAGLTVKREKDSSFYDRFRDRLIFPIDDSSGAIIGFTGRILSESTDQPKYVNTSESPVFKKGEALYAISHARDAIRKAGLAVMVEGQMDVITAHQYGFINTVATSGTALTADHLRLLKRITENIAFAFDADAAGEKALRAASLIAWANGLNPLVITIPYGKDPDESIRHNKELWDKAVKEALPALDYWLTRAFAGRTSLSGLQKKTISKDLISLIKQVPNAVEQAEYVRKLANELGISEQSIISDLKKTTLDQPTTTSPSPTVTDSSLNQSDLERQAIGLLLAYYSLIPALPAIHFENEALGQIYALIQKGAEHKGTVEEILQTVPKPWQDRLNTLILETLRRHDQLEQAAIKLEIVDCLQRLANREREERIHQNAQAIAKAFTSGDKAKAKELLKSLEHDIIVENYEG